MIESLTAVLNAWRDDTDVQI
ncbi:hypothetical protein, partial [Clavibacter michiganensis]